METNLEKLNIFELNGKLSKKGLFDKVSFIYNKENSKIRDSKILNSDTYIIYNHFYIFIMSVKVLHKQTVCNITLIDLVNKWNKTISIDENNINMPTTCDVGDIILKNRDYSIMFKCTKTGKRLLCHINDFSEGFPIDVDMSLYNIPENSVVTVDSIKEKSKTYYISNKINGIIAHGIVRHNNKEYLFKPNNSLASLDWYRGTDFYNNYINVQLCFDINSFPLYINLGHIKGYKDYKLENTILYKDNIIKVGSAKIKINGNYPKNNYDNIWKISTIDYKINFEFHPITKFLKNDKREVYSYIFGTFNGDFYIEGEKRYVDECLGYIKIK